MPMFAKKYFVQLTLAVFNFGPKCGHIVKFQLILKMLAPQLLSAARRTLPIILKRNIGICAPALQKASDPIQQLFIDKVKEYRQKSSALGGKLVDTNPEIEKELASELDKLAKQYGGGEGVDMTQFPNFKFTEPQLDPINQ
uniref:ATP synthase-coupling factor 6, mitochondrial n=1 Tax=Timema shepardi TaxID=629360 RepID=A0A7R9AQW0_TIMSH|nr:unnamed protein product [Timema shepardi]